MIFGMGMMEMGTTFSLVQLAIDDMIVSDIKKMINYDLGISMLADSAWPDNLAKKGFPHRFWSSHRVRDRSSILDVCKSTPEKVNVVEHARHKVETILNYHKPKPLAPVIIKRIREIVVEAEERRSGS